ncbi:MULTISPECIES: ATP-dependent zinc metalloprotease FtsH [Clostridium]|uniref:ATP-dependent zinc metalloprotease FtsH n=1 Tax=Clostridium butyricum E4 str. BoNT E BL5262 TaxID=632245 RepID=C4ID37_CLOBU|nr:MULTISPECIES: ATP-dependent zinc metalloprotease FtsH [Clostridium]EDT75503.1 putative Cell division protease FtsH [Clostridium butyricum 5521]EEP55855.1 cell division protease FtsH family protein [Clostridium butyricum E4 str. BoNT E BL5262]KQB78986.1 cell division protein FtsH [Clostridium butyricum]MDU0323475.1 ATP-dependent zinc metalloprotease FtsH [Clostridium butyricum]MDU1006576.1 ATP-dependent zinc metalloprotease FtsH [Clostridium butyricum]
MQDNNHKNNGKKNKNKSYTVVITYFIIAFAFVMAFNVAKDKSTTKEITYNKFIEMLDNKEISKVVITSDNLLITPSEDNEEYKGKTLYTAHITDDTLIDKLQAAQVDFTGKNPTESPFLNILMSWILPIGFFFFMWKFLFSKIGGGGGGVMSIGKNNAKVYMESEIKVTFDDVAGQEEAKESLKEVIDFLNCPAKYTEIGAKLPKGVLLVGPPGTGKTLIAKAVAGEAKVPFFSLSGSSFVEMFVGVGASRVRELFKDAVAKAPCIVFIDEIDAIGKSRDNQMQSNDEREQTLNQLLSEMDGFDSSKGVVLLGATNRPEVLDKALLRPGRFDRRVIVDRPEFKGREAILKVHAKNIILGDDVDLEEIARSTAGAVGADLANVINEAALRAVRRRRKVVLQEDLREAVEVIIAGKEKKDAILSEKEREIVSYHEVGHALVSAMLKNTKPVHKITIVPRMTGSLGYTMQIEDEEEKFLKTKDEMMNEIKILLGGRSAEEEKFDLVTSGASNDIERATQLARAMISMYGMSEQFDMMALESVQNRYLDGRAVRNCSEQTSTVLDNEVLKIIKEAHAESRKILRENRELLDKISAVLIEKENIFGDEFMDLIYEVYPEKKEEAEKEKIEKEKRLKEVEERRARRHALDKPIEEEVNKTINLSAGFENQEVKPIIENTDSVISESEESASSHEDNKVIEDVKDDDTKQ